MIGNEEFAVIRKVSNLYSGVGGNNKSLTNSLPTGGCCLQIHVTGSPTTPSTTIVGTADKIPNTTEVIGTIDSIGIAYSYKLWTAITTFNTNYTTITIYPASETGELISNNNTTTIYIKGRSYIVNPNQFRGLYQEVGGNTYKAYRALEFDKRFTLLEEDKIVISGKTYTVRNIEDTGRHSRQAFLGIER